MIKNKTIFRVTSNNWGFTLPLVLCIITVLLILSFSAYSLSMNNRQILSKSLDKDIALYNAESAYNKALWQLNNIGYSFYTMHDTSPIDDEFNSKPYRFYRLPDGDNYRLEILVPLREIIDMPGKFKEDNNNLIIRATGWDIKTPNYLRTIEVEVYKRTFTQHALVNGNEWLNGQEGGKEIWWTTNDEMYGPIHTNDVLFIDGNPKFYGLVTVTKGIKKKNSTVGDANIFINGVEQRDSLEPSPSNPELKAHAITNGDYYKGRTCINLVNDGYNVRTYDVNNEVWKYNNIEYRFVTTPNRSKPKTWNDKELQNEAASDSSIMFQRVIRNPNGTINEAATNASDNSFSSFDKLKKSDAFKNPIPLPKNGVIYVDGETGGGTTGNSARTGKMAPDLGNVFVSGILDGQLTIAVANDIYIVGHDPCDWRDPAKSEDIKNEKDMNIPWFNATPNDSSKTIGVIYKNTGFKQVTKDDIWDRTEVTGIGNDMLGLVANRKVHVLQYHWPSNFGNYYWETPNPKSTDFAPKNICIYGAIYSTSDSFGAEDWQAFSENKGFIEFVGSMTQAFRGPVGQVGGNGYNKNYSHDPRMLLDAPPFYPLPEDIGWLSSRWNETDDHILAKGD